MKKNNYKIKSEMMCKQNEVCNYFEWDKWVNEIPNLKFKEDWDVRVIPPFGCAIVRFLVYKNNKRISVYLDCYSTLGACSEPYWEIYPHKEDVFRCSMSDTETLLKEINNSLNDIYEN